MKTFRFEVSSGASYQIDAVDAGTAISILTENRETYPIPRGSLVGLDGRKPRFFLKRKDGDTLWPISAEMAALETHVLNAKGVEP